MRQVILLILAIVAAPAVAMPPAKSTDQGPPAKSGGQRQSLKPVRTVTPDGYQVQLNLGTQMLRLSVPEDRGWSRDESSGELGKPAMDLPADGAQPVNIQSLKEQSYESLSGESVDRRLGPGGRGRLGLDAVPGRGAECRRAEAR